tara:strand:- start:537 stop:794 length:258 start_codon:yes stop_codon:yes gene_type:complete
LEKINLGKDSLFNYIDLRGIPCPVNFIRCSLAVENLKENEYLRVDVDKGEPEESILSGLSKAGHVVKVIKENEKFLTLQIKHFER